MIQILQKVGSNLNDSDYAFIQSRSKTNFLKQLKSMTFRDFKVSAKSGEVETLEEQFKDFGRDMKDMLFGLLKFDPKKRFSA